MPTANGEKSYRERAQEQGVNYDALYEYGRSNRISVDKLLEWLEGGEGAKAMLMGSFAPWCKKNGYDYNASDESVNWDSKKTALYGDDGNAPIKETTDPSSTSGKTESGSSVPGYSYTDINGNKQWHEFDTSSQEALLKDLQEAFNNGSIKVDSVMQEYMKRNETMAEAMKEYISDTFGKKLGEAFEEHNKQNNQDQQ